MVALESNEPWKQWNPSMDFGEIAYNESYRWWNRVQQPLCRRIRGCLSQTLTTCTSSCQIIRYSLLVRFLLQFCHGKEVFSAKTQIHVKAGEYKNSHRQVKYPHFPTGTSCPRPQNVKLSCGSGVIMGESGAFSFLPECYREMNYCCRNNIHLCNHEVLNVESPQAIWKFMELRDVRTACWGLSRELMN